MFVLRFQLFLFTLLIGRVDLLTLVMGRSPLLTEPVGGRTHRGASIGSGSGVVLAGSGSYTFTIRLGRFSLAVVHRCLITGFSSSELSDRLPDDPVSDGTTSSTNPGRDVITAGLISVTGDGCRGATTLSIWIVWTWVVRGQGKTFRQASWSRLNSL